MHADDLDRSSDYSVSEKPVSPKAFKLSRCSLILITAGGLLCFASYFLPWGVTPNAYQFLPFTPPLNLGLTPVALPATFEFATLGIILRVATIMIWLGVILHEFTNKRTISHSVLLASSLLILAAFGMFAYTGLTPSWGAYLSLAGALSVAFGVITERLEVEVTLETEPK
jgi:hypothetical protein